MIVTGVDSGVGRALSQMLAHYGAKVVGAGEEIQQVKQAMFSIRDRGGEAIGCAVDVADSSRAGSLIDAAVERFGKVDVFVLSAKSAGQPARLLDPLREELDRALLLEMEGYIVFIREAAKQMVRQGHGGRIVILSPKPEDSISGAIRDGLSTLAVSMAREWGHYGITVNQVRVGEAVRPEEAASLALFLASDAAEAITGASIPVDGGAWID